MGSVELITWPQACVGCGSQDPLGITQYYFEIGKGNTSNYSSLAISGGGYVYLCSECHEFGRKEQSELVRSRATSLFISLVILMVYGIYFSVFMNSNISIFESVMTFLVVLLFFSSPTLIYYWRWTRIRSLEPFLSYINIVNAQGWIRSHIRIELRNLEFMKLLREHNESLDIKHKSNMKIANVSPGKGLVYCSGCPLAITVMLLMSSFFMGYFGGDYLMFNSFFVPILILSFIPYFMERSGLSLHLIERIHVLGQN